MSGARNMSATVHLQAQGTSPGPLVPDVALPDDRLSDRATRALGQMSPELAKQVHASLFGRAKGKRMSSPEHHSDATRQMTVLAVFDAVLALGDYGVVPKSIAEMVTVEALDIICRRVDDVIWEEVNLCRVLMALRQQYRYNYLFEERTPGPLRHRISWYLGAARRHQWDYLRTPAECIAGAVAAAGFADLLAAIGHPRAQSRFRDAVILAIGAETNFRTQEYHYIDVETVRFTVEDGVEEASVFMAARFCKNRKGRIGVVYDPAALILLRRLVGDRKTGPLFCTSRGDRLSEEGIAEALRRTSLMTLGVPLTANLLRRAGVSDEEDEGEMARRIGDSASGSRTAIPVRYYSKSVAREGLVLNREA